MIPMKRTVVLALLFFGLNSPVKHLFGEENAPVLKLTLSECILHAEKDNTNLQNEREKISELENDYQAAAAGLYPRVSISAYYQQLDSNRLGVLPAMAYSEEMAAQAKVKQVLFDGGKLSNNRKAARKAEAAQKESAEAGRLDTILAASQSYFRVLEAREILKVSETSLAQRQAFLQLTESFVKAGRAARLELLKAEAQVLDAERIQILAREAYRVSELILKKVIGVDLGRSIEVENSLPNEFFEPSEEGLLREAMTHNPDLKKIGLVKEQSEAYVRSANALFWPEISLQGAYGYRTRDTTNSWDSEWTAGVFLEWSLFEGGLTRAQSGKAHSRVRQIAWTEQAIRDQVQVDLRETLGNIRTALASIKSTRRLVEAQDEAYQAAVAFYERGKSTYLEVLTAQADLTQAKAAYIRAVGDYQNGNAKLDRIIGKTATQ